MQLLSCWACAWHTQSGKEMLGRLSTDKGKMWVLQHLGRKHHVPIATLNHSSNGFLAIQVCCCMLLCVFALRPTVANTCTQSPECQHVV